MLHSTNVSWGGRKGYWFRDGIQQTYDVTVSAKSRIIQILLKVYTWIFGSALKFCHSILKYVHIFFFLCELIFNHFLSANDVISCKICYTLINRQGTPKPALVLWPACLYNFCCGLSGCRYNCCWLGCLYNSCYLRTPAHKQKFSIQIYVLFKTPMIIKLIILF
jgi:hypothetical protein